MQKFIKETTKKKLVIPNAVLELGGLEKGEPVEIRAADSAVIILRKGMTAMEIIRAVDSLQRLAVELNGHLPRLCLLRRHRGKSRLGKWLRICSLYQS